MTRLVAVVLSLALAPSAALACTGCVASPYGDRTFGWAYLILYAAPFFVASAVAGALAYSLRARRPDTAGWWRGAWLFGRWPRRAPGASAHETLALRHVHGPDKETT
jgi:hypothetical protein